MVHKVLLWSGFGIAVRLWQLGIEMRPLFNRGSLWAYPLYAGVGGSVGYWLIGVEERQEKFLTDKRDSLLAKRRRLAERIRQSGDEEGEPAMLAQGGAGVSGLAMSFGEMERERNEGKDLANVISQKEALEERAKVGAAEAGRMDVTGARGEGKES
ncbi:MAG: hypothetical protein M1828_005238 [Chrysothrix sp. TS-e1954]|nr:MAG: hypothetical protein M1828_005238 [Chrysothrix sp. TS-e1954]